LRLKSNFYLTILIAGLVFLVEFFLKNYLRNFLLQSFKVFDKILYITVIPNTGAAFGVLKDNANLLIYVGILFLLFFFRFVFKEKNKNLLFLISSGLIIGGALSNIYDRVFYGYVLDYIDLRFWPVFNLADSCISIGVILLLFDSFRKKNEAGNNS